MTESGSAHSFSTGGQGYHIKARVEFDDGTTSEISCKVHRGLGTYDIGEALSFRFDPSGRSKIVLGEPVLKAYGEEMKAKVKEIERENAERPIPHYSLGRRSRSVRFSRSPLPQESRRRKALAAS